MGSLIKKLKIINFKLKNKNLFVFFGGINLNRYFEIFPENLINKNKRDFILLTIPKTGTHLILKCLILLTASNTKNRKIRALKETIKDKEEFQKIFKNNDDFTTAHFFYSHYYIHNFYSKKIISLRDPRDQLVSWVFHQIKFLEKENASNFNKDEIQNRLKKTLKDEIEGKSNINLKAHYKELISFFKFPYCFIRFEDLIGEKGGGSIERQKKAIKKIANYLKKDIKDNQLEFIISNFFVSESHYFRKGIINQWKDYFDEKINNLFYEAFGDITEMLGYK